MLFNSKTIFVLKYNKRVKQSFPFVAFPWDYSFVVCCFVHKLMIIVVVVLDDVCQLQNIIAKDVSIIISLFLSWFPSSDTISGRFQSKTSFLILFVITYRTYFYQIKYQTILSLNSWIFKIPTALFDYTIFLLFPFTNTLLNDRFLCYIFS